MTTRGVHTSLDRSPAYRLGTALGILRAIVQAWSADEHHDVPLSLIERAREYLKEEEAR